jgi:hypothetical protein
MTADTSEQSSERRLDLQSGQVWERSEDRSHVAMVDSIVLVNCANRRAGASYNCLATLNSWYALDEPLKRLHELPPSH